MSHHFEPEDAEKYGILEAVLLSNIRFWIEKNKANEKHFHNGSYWTYNSAKAFSVMFSYASKQQIQRALKKLEDMGALKSDEFNENKWDHTKWYSVSDESNLINRKIGIDQSHTDVNTYINTYTKEDVCPHKDIIAIWSELLPTMPQVREWTPARQKMLRSRWLDSEKRQNLDWWRKFFTYLTESDFLMGRVHVQDRKTFEVSLDWLLKQDNFVKCLEGKYHAKDKA